MHNRRINFTDYMLIDSVKSPKQKSAWQRINAMLVYMRQRRFRCHVTSDQEYIPFTILDQTRHRQVMLVLWTRCGIAWGYFIVYMAV